MHSEENSPQTAAAYADSFDFCPFDLVQIVDAITQFGVGWQVSERFTAPVHGNSGTFAVIMCRHRREGDTFAQSKFADCILEVLFP